MSKQAKDAPFGDPVFLQAVGEMTISFAMLDGFLSHAINTLEHNADMPKIAEMRFSDKVNRFIEIVQLEFDRLGSAQFTTCEVARLKDELKGVANLRNSLNHDFWTLEPSGLITVKSLKRKKGVPDQYPTPARIKTLATRTWAVRSRLAEVLNERSRLLKAEGRGEPS